MARRGGADILPGHVQIHGADHVVAVAVDKQAEGGAHARVHVEESVGAVAPVEAKIHIHRTSIADPREEAGGQIAHGRVVGQHT